MSFNIESKLHDALRAKAAAMAAHAEARDAWRTGAAAAFAQAKAQHAELQSKITAAEDAAAHAETTFKTAFAAAGYEQTAAVRNALASKQSALDMAQELRHAQAQCTKAMAVHGCAASAQGRVYRDTYHIAYAAHAAAEAYQAIHEAGSKIAQAMALVSNAPEKYGCAYEIFDGGITDLRQAEQSRWAFVWTELQAMARHMPGYTSLHFDGVEPLDFGALPPSKWLSPAQMMKHRAAAK